jgi:hypothetical protein
LASALHGHIVAEKTHRERWRASTFKSNKEKSSA